MIVVDSPPLGFDLPGKLGQRQTKARAQRGNDRQGRLSALCLQERHMPDRYVGQLGELLLGQACRYAPSAQDIGEGGGEIFVVAIHAARNSARVDFAPRTTVLVGRMRLRISARILTAPSLQHGDRSAMPYSTCTVGAALDGVNRTFFLPAIQRPFVWKQDQVLGLFDSLLKGYPISAFMFWALDDLTMHDVRI